MRKIIAWVAVSSMLVGLAACQKPDSGVSKSSSRATQSTRVAVSKKKENSSSAASTSAATSSSAAKQSASSNQFPYAVAPNQLGGDVVTFHFSGINVPAGITLNLADKTATRLRWTNPQHTKTRVELTAPMTMGDIPTKQIRVFSADSSGIRTVSVNTEVTIQFPEANHDNFYLFRNRAGTISFATPNYAGNVDQKDADVMIETLK